MSRTPLAALITVMLVTTACSTGASSTPSASPPASSASSASGPVTREVKLTDALKIEPAEIKVPIGQAITFRVTNAGANDHEFVVGDEALQMAHENQMVSMPGMDMQSGLSLKPGETKELTMTFNTAGTTFAACLRTGHYAGGMKATITIGS